MASTTSSTSWGFVALLDLRELVHQLLVHVQAAGGVDDQHVAAVGLRLAERPLGHVHRVAAGALLVDRRAGLLADLDELVHRGGALQVAGGHRDVHLLLLAQVARQLAAGGGLARALQAGHEDHRRAALGEHEVAPRAAHELGQLLVDDLHHLLARVQRLQHLGAQRPLLHRARELLDDLEVHVGLEQREAHLAHRLGDVVLGQLAARADVAQGVLQAL